MTVENKDKICKIKDCDRDLFDEEHCIFHSKDIEGKKAQFEEEFWKEFERQKENEVKYDFYGFVFPKGISFEKKEFEKNAIFMGAQFSGKADFGNAQFCGKADFIGAQFAEITSFLEAEFSGETSFLGTEFSENVTFTRAQFYGTVDFFQAKFAENVYFCEAQFSWLNGFDQTEFLGKADFKKISFKNVEKFTMIDTVFNDVTGLFESIEANKDKFKYTGKTELLPDDFKLILGEKVAARYPIYSRQSKDDMYLINFKKRHPIMFFLWWLFADCGRSITRWALWSFFLSMLFAFIYHNVFYLNDITTFTDLKKIFIDNIHDTWPGFSFIYYSVVTFTTLGFGDIVPKPGWLQFWVMAEVILGYIMLGGLISILANKLARRS
jgi:hypothetical protein